MTWWRIKWKLNDSVSEGCIIEWLNWIMNEKVLSYWNSSVKVLLFTEWNGDEMDLRLQRRKYHLCKWVNCVTWCFMVENKLHLCDVCHVLEWPAPVSAIIVMMITLPLAGDTISATTQTNNIQFRTVVMVVACNQIIYSQLKSFLSPTSSSSSSSFGIELFIVIV